MISRFPIAGADNGVQRKLPNNEVGPKGRLIARVILILSVVAVFVGTVMPQSAVAWLRQIVPPFALIWDSLDALLPWLNPLHIILYAWVGALWRTQSPNSRIAPIFLIGGLFSVVTEALQLLAPGRTARPTDVLNNLAGIALGLILVEICRVFWSSSRAVAK